MDNQINKDYVVNSLTNQIANLSLGNAEKDAVIASQHERIQELEKELEETRNEQIKEMNSDAE